MIINTAQSVLQLQNSLKVTYKDVALTLNGDTSSAGNIVRNAITNFITLPTAQLTDLINLREALYTYQNQLINKVSLNAAAEKLLLNVKSFIVDNQIGYTMLDSGLARESAGPTYAQILNDIKIAVAGIPISFTSNDIATAVAIGASNNTDLISKLELDFDYAHIKQRRLSPQNIRSNIAEINGTDGPSIAASLYDIFASNTSNILLSSSQGAVALNNAISLDNAINSVPYAAIINNITAAVESLLPGFTKNDIATAVVTAIGAGNNADLINKLELDFDYACSTQGNLSPQNIQSNITRITGTDAPSITASFYNIFLTNVHLSSSQGAVALNNAISLYNTTNNVPYDIISNNIKTGVEALSGIGLFSNYDVATAIATAIGAEGDIALINALELDFDQSGPAANIQANIISNLPAIDGPSITVSIYSSFNNPIPTYLSAIQGLLTLSNYITEYNINHAVPYTVISNSIAAGIAALSGVNLTYNTVATTIATVVDASDNAALINALELDLNQYSQNNSAANIQSNMAYYLPVITIDAPLIAASIYGNIVRPDALTSALQGAVTLSRAITADYTNNAVPYANIVSYIQGNVTSIPSENLTSDAIANSIATAIGAGNGNALIAQLELDLDSAAHFGFLSSTIKSNMAGISGSDGPSIAASLYNQIAPSYLLLSSLQGAVALSNDIALDYTANFVSYANIVSYIQGNVSSIPSANLTNNAIATAIATAIGAKNDLPLINRLELDFDSGGLSPTYVQTQINFGIAGTDAPSIVASIYNSISPNFFFLSSLQGAVSLSQIITDDYTNNAVPYVNILSYIQGNVTAIPSANLTNSAIAIAIATAIEAGNNTGLISKLELDFDVAYRSGRLPQNIQEIISSIISGSDGPSIAATLYNQLLPAFILSSLLQDAVALSDAIIANNNAGVGPSYYQILSNIQAAVRNLSGANLTNNAIATAIATAVGASNNIDLISKLELGFDSAAYFGASPAIIQRDIINIYTIDGPSIALSLYNSFYDPKLSALQGAIALSNDIKLTNTENSVPYATILKDIKSEVDNLSITNDKIANAIAEAIVASTDTALINALEIDLDASNNSAIQIQANIAYATGSDGPSIATSIYNLISFSAVSMIPVVVSLSNAIATENNGGSGPDYSVILTNIQSAVGALNGASLTNNNIVNAIITAVGAGSDTALINQLELISSSSLLPTDFQQYVVNKVTGTDGPSIAASIAGVFDFYFAYLSLGASLLSNDITANYNPGSELTYAKILTNIKKTVHDAASTNNDIATAIAIAVAASNDTALINALEFDFDNAQISIGVNSTQIKSNIANISSITDGPSITNAIYSSIYYSGWLLASQGALLLSNDITYNNEVNSVSYADIISNIQEAVNALPSSTPTNATVFAIAGAFNASSDSSLINALDVYFNSQSLSELQTCINSIAGTDGPSITNSIYTVCNNRYYTINEEVQQGSTLLANDISAYYGFYNVTMTSAIGDNPIGPQAFAYLNKCILAAGSYTVGGSVFSGFDPQATGPLLSSMVGLNTLTGQMAALSQCGSWVYNSAGIDLYATTSYIGGTVGNASATGCTALLTSGDVMALCHSVFDMSAT